MHTRYYLYLSFKGTNYHGWQIQPNAITVQEVIQNALSTILEEKIEIVGAGRTDTGVHASFFCAHFDSNNKLLAIDNDFIYRLNGYLPKDIAIISISKVTPDAHARFSAKARTYKYYISLKKLVFHYDYSWFLPKQFNVELMNQACEILKKETDFTSFSKLHTDVKTNNCVIYEAYWTSENDMLVFTIKADRFLRNMVRAIVGTMVQVGLEKMTLEGFSDVIKAKDRCKAGQSVPAKGLFLVDITY